MNKEALLNSITTLASVSFARSGGPGGQNVNKVNTKVYISIPVDLLGGLSPEEKDRIRSRLSNRITEPDSLFINVDDERSQLRNREIAEKRLFDLIVQAAAPVKVRRPTKPSKASRVKRMAEKKIRSIHKSGRRSPANTE